MCNTVFVALINTKGENMKHYRVDFIDVHGKTIVSKYLYAQSYSDAMSDVWDAFAKTGITVARVDSVHIHCREALTCFITSTT